MVFAVEEINRDSSLLPGVKLGYRIMDSCDQVHTSLQALFSLVTLSEDRKVQTLSTMVETGELLLQTNVNQSGVVAESVAEINRTESLYECLAGSPVSAVIGLASSSPTRAVAHTVGPFNIPLVRK